MASSWPPGAIRYSSSVVSRRPLEQRHHLAVMVRSLDRHVFLDGVSPVLVERNEPGSDGSKAAVGVEGKVLPDEPERIALVDAGMTPRAIEARLQRLGVRVHRRLQPGFQPEGIQVVEYRDRLPEGEIESL